VFLNVFEILQAFDNSSELIREHAMQRLTLFTFVILSGVMLSGCGGTKQAGDPAETPSTAVTEPADPTVAPETPLNLDATVPGVNSTGQNFTPSQGAIDSAYASTPKDATGVVLVRSRQARNRPWAQEVMKHMPEAQESLLGDDGLVQMLFVMAPLSGEPEAFGPPAQFAMKRTYETAQQAAAALGERTQRTAEYKGVVLHENAVGGALGLAGASLYESESLDLIKQMIDGGGPSPELQTLLDKAGSDKDLTMAVDLRSMPKFVEGVSEELQRNPMTAALANVFRNLQHGYASANLEGDRLVDLQLQMTDNESADQLATIANGFLPLGKGMALQQLNRGFDAETGKLLAEPVNVFFESVKVVANGDQVQGTISTPSDFAAWPGKYIPVVTAARKKIDRRNNLKQIGLALHNYYDVHQSLPPAVFRDEQGKALYSWRVAILPFLEQSALYDQFHLDEPWDSAHNKPLSDTVLEVYGADNTTRLLAFVGPGTVFEQHRAKTGLGLSSVTDGTSNTVMFVQAGPDKAVPWAKPVDIAYDGESDPIPLLGNVPDGELWTVFVDSSLHNIDLKSAGERLKFAILRNDGEVPGF